MLPHGLTGFHHFKIDGKSRLFIPSPFRKDLSGDMGEVVVLFVPTVHLLLFNKDYWTENIQRPIIDKGKVLGPETVWRVIHRLSEHSTVSAIDSQGRITIPKDLLKKAMIEDTVVMIGVYDRVSVWNPDIYDEWVNKENIDPDIENLGLF